MAFVVNQELYWKRKVKSWYLEHDNWGLKEEADEKNRVQLLLAELPALKFKNVLIISWKATETFSVAFTGSQVSMYSLQPGTKKAKSIDTPVKLLSVLAKQVEEKQQYDLIILDRVVYTGVMGNSLSLLRMYIQDLLAAKGLIVSCCVSTFIPPRFPLLLYEESYIDFLDDHYLVRMYLK